MSGRIAVALCLAAFFATASPWMSNAWSALAAAVEEEPAVEPGKGEEGWLIDPNG